MIGEPRIWSARRADGHVRWSWFVVADWMACKRRFRWSVVDDLVPLYRSPALSLGSCYHYGMEAAWRLVQKAQTAFAPIDAKLVTEAGVLAQQAAAEYPYVGEDARETAMRLLAAYWREDGPAILDTREWGVLGVEKSITGVIGPGVRWDATVDLLVQVGDPAPRVWHGLWVVNWKTASDLREGTFLWARRDGQFLSEQAAARAAGMPIRGLILAVVTKGRQPAFVRDYVEWRPDLIDAFVRDMVPHVRAARTGLKRGPWTQNYGSCAGRWGPCPYWDLCEDGASARALYGTRAEAARVTAGDDEVTLAEDW